MITPDNQTVSLHSTDVRVFDYNDPNSRYYIGNVINSILGLFGDGIIEGLNVEVEIIDENNIKFIVSPGKIILDTTQINYTSGFEINFNTSGYNPDGSLVLSIDYSYSQIMYENKSKVDIYYISSDSSVLASEWYSEQKHCILGVFNINGIEIVSPTLSPKQIKIKNIDYDIRPLPSLYRRGINIVNSGLYN